MANGTEIAKAYVQIIPSMDGVKNNIANELGIDTTSLGASAGTSFANGFGSAIETIGKVSLAAIGAAAAGVATITKQAVDSYAEYEQLVGGAQLMFGDAYGYIAEKASSAYQTVQMSQNDYLQQVNGFATGLKTSMNGNEQAAAELADRIVTAEADIVAATGNTQENVQNAFNGIMKNNFTMLDNLQLGITPTKEGMQEVIDKMNEINGTQYEMGNLADMQNAIIDYIDYVGMSGYASAEAADTIQGSMASASASWQNLLTGLADSDADLTSLINGVVNSFSQVAKNIMPVITQAVSGIGQLITQLTPIISEALPGILEEIIPTFIEAATSLVVALTNALPDLLAPLIEQMPFVITSIMTGLMQALPAVMDMIPSFVEMFMQVLTDIANSLAEMAPTLMPQITSLITGVINIIIANAPMLLNAALQLVSALGNGLVQAIPQLVEQLPQIIQGICDFFISAIPQIVDVGVQLLVALVDNLPLIIDTVIAAIPVIVDALVQILLNADTLAKIIEAGVYLFISLVANLATIIDDIIAVIPDIIDAIIARVGDFFAPVAELGYELFMMLIDKASDILSEIIEWCGELLTSIGDKIKEGWDTLSQIGTYLIEGLWNGMENAVDWLIDKIQGLCSDAYDAIKDFFGIASPSKETAWLGEMIGLGLATGIEDSTQDAVNAAMSMSDEVLNGLSGVNNDLENALNGNMTINGSMTANGQNDALATVYDLLNRYLPTIAENGETSIVLEGDARKIFNAVRKENETYRMTTGMSAFI